ncbi:MAG: hypothetical protein LCI02_00560 [Proteobacteria bacterium]|nr:hypothetical protein [Pseudomonadota bacterium]
MDEALPTPAENRIDADDPRQRALARLQASRNQLQQAWLPRAAAASGARGPRRLAATWRHWRRQLAGNAIVGFVFEAAADWWRANPWRAAGEAVAEEVHQSLTPVVRRHPFASVALVAAAAAAVAVAKPWRWPLVAQQLRPLPGRAGRWLLRQLSRAPLQSLIIGAVLASGSGAAAASSPAPPPRPDTDPDPDTPAGGAPQAAA